MSASSEGQARKQALPSCLVRLGLDLHADERAIRRAYAQRLKQLNPDTDPQGFQSLRHAYESALNWHSVDRKAPPALAHVVADEPAPQPTHDVPATPEPAAVPPATEPSDVPAPPEPADVPSATEPAPALPVPAPIAGPCVTDLLDLLRHKLDAGDLRTRSDVRAWLSATLDIGPLIDLDARFAFERGVAVLLAEGWKPGRELLFGPAIDCFGWAQEGGHLAQFDHPGERVAMAIRDLQAVDTQPDDVKLAMRDLTRQLRTGTRPGTSVLLAQLPLLEQMGQRHPDWLHIVTDVRGIQRWREWERAAPHWRRWLARKRADRAAAPSRGSSFKLHRVLFALLLLSVVMRALEAPSRSGATPKTPTTPMDNTAPLEVSALEPNKTPTYLRQAWLIYPPDAQRLGHQGKVTLIAHVDARGKAQHVRVEHSAGHLALDEAAAQAAQRATYVVARDTTGTAVPRAYRIPVDFRLEDVPRTSAAALRP